MKAKTKLISTIVAMCLVITLGVFGILAVKTLNMSVGGNISFTADGVALEVSQGTFKTTDDKDYSNILTQEGKLQGFVMNTDKTEASIQTLLDSWKNLELVMDSKGDAVLHFSVTNKMTTPLYVYIATEFTTNTNNNMNLSVSPNGTQIAAGLTTSFEITFDIIDTSINAGLTGFKISIDFTKEERVSLKAQNKIDQSTGLETIEVDYYYIEMGTYNGQPVRWRYVADSTGKKYDGTSKVISVNGYYVLETEIKITQTYLASSKYSTSTYKHTTEGYTNICANDYGISDIRKYLTNEGSGGFMNALGISTTDKVYSLIEGRTVTDLYSNINGTAGTAITSSNTSYSLSLTGDKSVASQTDKFWLLSQSEANTFFSSNSERIWGTSGTNVYWLRSPYSDYAARFVMNTGSIDYRHVFSAHGVRPAFKI